MLQTLDYCKHRNQTLDCCKLWNRALLVCIFIAFKFLTELFRLVPSHSEFYFDYEYYDGL